MGEVVLSSGSDICQIRFRHTHSSTAQSSRPGHSDNAGRVDIVVAVFSNPSFSQTHGSPQVSHQAVQNLLDTRG